MKDWTIKDRTPMYDTYKNEPPFGGIGEPCGYNVRIQTIRNIQVDVWGHGEGKEETERIANMITSLPTLTAQISNLKEQVRKLKEELKDNGRDDINYELLNPEHDWK